MIVVAYLINQLRKSGPVNVLYNLVCNLDRSKYKPIVIKLMKDDVNKSVTSAFKQAGIHIIEFDFSFWDLELKTSQVANIINGILSINNVNIIHSHGYHPLLISSYIKSNIIKFDTQHCFSLDSFRSSRGWIIGTYMHCRYLYRLRKITAGISISKSVEKYYRNLGIKIPFHTIYNGIDLAEFTLNENKKYWKKKIGIDEHAITFVVVGHLSKLKDPLLVIKSYISLINKGLLKNTVLIFCGSGLEEKKCKELAKPYSQILFKGYVFNVSDYLKAADFSICASHSEGFGLNYIEAMAAGAFVLSSKIPAFNEFAEICPILKEYQFGVGNQKELEKCMLSVGGGIVDKLCISSGIIEKFSSENMGKEHMDLYEKYYKNGNDFK